MFNSKEYQTIWRNKNKDKIKKYRKNYFIKNKDKIMLFRKTEKEKFRKRKIKYKYNISFEEYKILIYKQKNLCAICGKKEKNKSLAIDHNHKSKKVRGLLCQKCNRGIGLFNDNLKLLNNAYLYLSK